MDGPWYECTGPTYTQVRSDVEKIAQREIDSLNIEVFKNASEKVIPETRNNFGSWRGYGTFGVANEVYNEVYVVYLTEMEKRKKAIEAINETFMPCVKHHLWKPGGKMMERVAETTLVGKEVDPKKSTTDE